MSEFEVGDLRFGSKGHGPGESSEFLVPGFGDSSRRKGAGFIPGKGMKGEVQRLKFEVQGAK